MPKKNNKGGYSNYSALHTGSHAEVWDDTELIQEYEAALDEWRLQSGQWREVRAPKVVESTAASADYDSTLQAAPAIGPWIAVEAQAFDPDSIHMNPVLDIDDREFLRMFDTALTEWKEDKQLIVRSEPKLSAEETETIADATLEDQAPAVPSEIS